MNVLVVGDVHGNEPAGEAIIAALRKRAHRRRHVLARAHRQPRRAREGHAPERARRRPQPQLPLALADRPARHLLPRPEGGLGARDAGADAARAARQAAARDLLPPGARDDRPRRGRRPRRAARVRAPHRAAGPLAAGLPRDGDRLAEPRCCPTAARSSSSCTPVRRRCAGTSTPCWRWRGRRADEARPRPPRRRRSGARSGQHTSTHRHPAHRAGPRGGRAALRERLAGREFALVLASPRARALETARLAGFEPEIEPDLAEVDYGDYEGRTTPEIREQRPGWSLWADGSPGGETLAQAGERADRVIARALAAGGDVARLRPRPHPARARRPLDRAPGPSAAAASRSTPRRSPSSGFERETPRDRRLEH